jgi:hypothetical protein
MTGCSSQTLQMTRERYAYKLSIKCVVQVAWLGMMLRNRVVSLIIPVRYREAKWLAVILISRLSMQIHVANSSSFNA